MNSDINDDDAPLDPSVERVRRKVMRLMAVSVAIMMVGLMAVIGAIFYKFSGSNSKNTAVVANNNQQTVMSNTGEIKSIDAVSQDMRGSVKLPEGTRLINTEFSNNRILMTIKSDEDELFLWVYDLAANRVFARISIEN